MDMELKEFCEKLPKIELHAHLNGSIPIDELQKYDNTFEYPNEHGNSFTSSLERCFKFFDAVHGLINDPETLYSATCSVIKSFHDDNVIYLELRSTPREVLGLMTKGEYIETVIQAIRNSSETLPNIIVKLLISVDRAQSLESADMNVKLAIKYHRKHPEYVVGVDLSGNPTEGYPFLQALKLAQFSGLKIAAHCAEHPNKKEAAEILDFKPDRLGHCTCIHPTLDGSQELYDKLLESKIPVELCLTSNVRICTVPDFSLHQFNYLYKSKHPICIATDDQSAFFTSLSQEYYILATEFKLSKKELFDLSLAAVEYAFTTEDIKIQLRQKIQLFGAANIDNYKQEKET